MSRQLPVMALVLASTLGLSAALVAPADAVPPATAAHHRLAVGSDPQRLVAAGHRWLEQQRSALAGSQRGPGSPDQIAGLGETTLTEAGDLNGDGRGDLLDFRTVGNEFRRHEYGITARDGRTGRRIWRHEVHEPGDAFDFAQPMMVGVPGRQGVLLEREVDVQKGGQDKDSVTLTAWDGSTGKPLWTESSTGSASFNGSLSTADNEPGVEGLFHDIPGRDQDVLMSRTNSDGFDDHVTPMVVSGRDGSITSRHEISTQQQGSRIQISPEPDLNGDGLDDILVVVPGNPPLPGLPHKLGHSRAIRGDTGARIWTNHGIDLYDLQDILDVGHVSGGDVPDFVFESINRKSDLLPHLFEFVLVRGTDGTILWRHSATSAVRLGRAGRHLRGAVGLLREPQSDRSGNRTFSSVTALGYAGNGNLIYSRTHRTSIRTVPNTKPRFGFDEATNPFGDVQPDGSQDVAVQLLVRSGDHRQVRNGIISGRNGRWLPRPFGLPTDGSLRHGHGTDIMVPLQRGHRFRLAGFSGRTGKRYFVRHLHVTDQDTTTAEGARVTGHSCSDILVKPDTHQIFEAPHFPVLFAVLSGSGHVLWTLRFHANRALGGSLVSNAPPKRFCS
jgi:hypothetical protein